MRKAYFVESEERFEQSQSRKARRIMKQSRKARRTLKTQEASK